MPMLYGFHPPTPSQQNRYEEGYMMIDDGYATRIDSMIDEYGRRIDAPAYLRTRPVANVSTGFPVTPVKTPDLSPYYVIAEDNLLLRKTGTQWHTSVKKLISTSELSKQQVLAELARLEEISSEMTIKLPGILIKAPLGQKLNDPKSINAASNIKYLKAENLTLEQFRALVEPYSEFSFYTGSPSIPVVVWVPANEKQIDKGNLRFFRRNRSVMIRHHLDKPRMALPVV